MPLIEARGLSVEYPGRPALAAVDLAIEPGEIVTVIGPNGSGKSTLVKALLGAIPITAGRVTRQRGLSIGYVPQKLSLDMSMPLSVLRFLHLPKRRPAAEVARVAAMVGIDTSLDRQLRTLSGGQFQRALLARAILGKPDLLILDEPTQGLDQPATGAFYHLLEVLRAETGCAILLVSHDLHVVMSASDRVICLNGHVCCEGAPHVVVEAPEYRALFGRGTAGTMALYRHEHDHDHDHEGEDAHDHAHHHHGHNHDDPHSHGTETRGGGSQ